LDFRGRDFNLGQTNTYLKSRPLGRDIAVAAAAAVLPLLLPAVVVVDCAKLIKDYAMKTYWRADVLEASGQIHTPAVLLLVVVPPAAATAAAAAVVVVVVVVVVVKLSLCLTN
jgi:hypothetical protein